MSSFSPENWHLIPVKPKMGLIDPYGGTSKEIVDDEKILETIQRTSLGLVSFHYCGDGLTMVMGELGMGLFYEKDGLLGDVGVDILKYCLSCSKKDLESMGGQDLDDFLEEIMDFDDSIYVDFDLCGGTAAILSMNKETRKEKIECVAGDIDFALSNNLRVEFKDYVVCMAFIEIEDEFCFGMMVSREQEPIFPDKTIPVIRVLSDCNYKTFLSSKSPERYNNLTKRVFLVGDAKFGGQRGTVAKK